MVLSRYVGRELFSIGLSRNAALYLVPVLRSPILFVFLRRLERVRLTTETLLPIYRVVVLASKRIHLHLGLVQYFCVNFFAKPRIQVVYWNPVAEFPRGKQQNHPELRMKLSPPT